MEEASDNFSRRMTLVKLGFAMTLQQGQKCAGAGDVLKRQIQKQAVVNMKSRTYQLFVHN